MSKHTLLVDVYPCPWPMTKAGAPRKNVMPVHYAPYTPLQDCERCQRRSTPKQVQYRADLSLTLCMACWNILRPLSRALDEIEALRKLCRKIEREAKAHG
jgi:hypothetical protein